MKTLYQMYNSTVLRDNSAESLDEVPRSIALCGYSNQNKNVNNTLNSISLRSSNDGIVPPTKNSKCSCKEQLAEVIDKFEDMRSYFEHQISTLEVNTMAKHKMSEDNLNKLMIDKETAWDIHSYEAKFQNHMKLSSERKATSNYIKKIQDDIEKQKEYEIKQIQQNAQLAYELKEAELNAIFLKELNDAQEIIRQEELEQKFKDMCNQNNIDEGYRQYEYTIKKFNKTNKVRTLVTTAKGSIMSSKSELVKKNKLNCKSTDAKRPKIKKNSINEGSTLKNKAENILSECLASIIMKDNISKSKIKKKKDIKRSNTFYR